VVEPASRSIGRGASTVALASRPFLSFRFVGLLPGRPLRIQKMSVIDRIRVGILHGDPVARTGLSVALGQYPDLDVCDEPEFRLDEPARFMRQSWQGRVDVVVSDLAHGVPLASSLGREPDANLPRVIVVAGIDREWEIRSALDRGVKGFLRAGCTFDELATGVRAVHRGARHLSPEVTERLVESMFSEKLTEREMEVMGLVVEGRCNKAIGNALGIAEGTVKSHLKSTFEKLSVRNRTQAVAAVERRGLLKRDRPPSARATMAAA
jgi:DNA-binding NarL/FixJ family response regulator